MKRIGVKIIFLWGLVSWGLTGCATTPDHFDTSYSRPELAALTSATFDIEETLAEKALQASYKKYGRPQGYISGRMSSIDDPAISRLHGTGYLKAKLREDKNIYWVFGGTELAGYSEPISTAHLIYETASLDNLDMVLQAIGSLNHEGQVFTIFERHIDNQIIVTIYKTNDLRRDASLKALSIHQM